MNDHQTNDHRKIMEQYLDESLQIITKLLSKAEFGDSFPHLFGYPDENNKAVSVRNECGLLLRKVQIHLIAIRRASETHNLHSLAVHMRVVLECAAPILLKAHAACSGSEKSFSQILNIAEDDFRHTSASLMRERVNWDMIQESIINARKGCGQKETKPPRKVTISEKISTLSSGKEWYDHVSKCFCSGDASVLSGHSFYGGVMSNTTENDEMAFTFFLNYLTTQIVSMLMGNGFLLIAVNGDTQPFNEAVKLMDRKNESTKSFNESRKY